MEIGNSCTSTSRLLNGHTRSEDQVIRGVFGMTQEFTTKTPRAPRNTEINEFTLVSLVSWWFALLRDLRLGFQASSLVCYGICNSI